MDEPLHAHENDGLGANDFLLVPLDRLKYFNNTLLATTLCATWSTHRDQSIYVLYHITTNIYIVHLLFHVRLIVHVAVLPTVKQRRRTALACCYCTHKFRAPVNPGVSAGWAAACMFTMLTCWSYIYTYKMYVLMPSGFVFFVHVCVFICVAPAICDGFCTCRMWLSLYKTNWVAWW